MIPNPSVSPLLQGAEARLSAVVDTLVKQGFAIVPGFVDSDTCRELAAECRTFRDQGEFHRAGVGRGEMLEVRPEIRSDEIRWLARNDCGPLQGDYLDLMAAYQQVLNRELFLGLVEFECFCAVYPPGSFYQRH
nr:hypothetical protein [Desulfuromonadales bacterium]